MLHHKLVANFIYNPFSDGPVAYSGTLDLFSYKQLPAVAESEVDESCENEPNQ